MKRIHVSRVWRISAAVAAALALSAGVAVANASSSQVAESADGSSARSFTEERVEVGIKFTVEASGELMSLHFLKSPDEAASKHRLTLWAPDGKAIARTWTKSETESGWQTAKLKQPIKVDAGKTYVASYRTRSYMATNNVNGISNATFKTVGSGGVFSYDNTMPAKSFKNSDYWVRVMIDSSGGTPATVVSAPSKPLVPTAVAPTTTTSAISSPVPVAPKQTTTTTARVAPTANVPAQAAPKLNSPHARPNAATTGVESASLRTIPSTEISTDNLVLDGVSGGNILITGDNIVIRNSRFDSLTIRFSNGVRVENSTLGGLSISSASNVVGNRLDIGGAYASDAIHITSDSGSMVTNVNISDSWIHNPNPAPDSHYDALQVRGVKGLSLTGNYFDVGPWMSQINAAIFLENANGGNSNVVIDSNWIDGGGYMFYIDGTGVTLKNNLIGSQAHWGLLYDITSAFTDSNNKSMSTGAPLQIR